MATVINEVASRWVIWHLTSQCNIECAYCYGSFEGQSYKSQWRPGAEIDLNLALEVPRAIKEAGFDRLHINGGEPLLRSEVWEVCRAGRDAGVGVWLLTNGTVRHRLIEQLAADDCLEVLAISLDSKDTMLGDALRGLTARALKGLSRAARAKATTRLGVYVVLTRENLDQVSSLFDFLEDVGVDYVNVQPVYLPIGHSMRDRLGIGQAEADRVADVMADLAERSFEATNQIVRTMAIDTLGRGPQPVSHCFAAAGDYAYISPSCVVLSCPSRPSGVEIGRRFETGSQLTKILKERARGMTTPCSWQSGDCLGMYEMATRNGPPILARPNASIS